MTAPSAPAARSAIWTRRQRRRRVGERAGPAEVVEVVARALLVPAADAEARDRAVDRVRRARRPARRRAASATPGRKPSSTTSARARSARASASPSADLRSQTTDSLPALSASCHAGRRRAQRVAFRRLDSHDPRAEPLQLPSRVRARQITRQVDDEEAGKWRSRPREPIEDEAMSTVSAKIVPLPQRQRGLSWILGLGAFGLALSLTTTSAYLPPLLQQFTDSRTLIAVVLGSEGLFALTLPLVIGPWSDTFQTPMGRRRPFMLVALGPLGFCLALVAFMPSLWLMTLILLAFFFAYYVYEPPYRGLYPDLLPPSEYAPLAGEPASPARARDRRRPDRRRLAVRHLASGAVPDHRGRDRRRPAARRSSSSTSRPAGRTASSRASARTSRTAGASSRPSPRCAASSSATRRGRGRSRARGSSSSSTSRRGWASRSRSAPPCWRRSRAAT